MRRGILNINDIIVLFVIFFVAIIIFSFFLLQKGRLDSREGKLEFAEHATTLTADFVLSAYLRQPLAQSHLDFWPRDENGKLVSGDGAVVPGTPEITMQEALFELLSDERCKEWLENDGRLDEEEDLHPFPPAPLGTGGNAQSTLCRAVHQATFRFFRSFSMSNLFAVTIASTQGTVFLGHNAMRGDPGDITDAVDYLEYNNLVGSAATAGMESRINFQRENRRLELEQFRGLSFRQTEQHLVAESGGVTVTLHYITRYDT